MARAEEAWAELKALTKLDYAMEHAQQPAPVPVGVPELDDALGGGMPVGTFTVIAGEGGAGKSAMACVAAYNAAVADRRPVFFSLEMPAHMVVSRMLSVHSSRIRSIQRARGVPDARLMRQVWWSTTRNVVTRIAGRDISDERDAAAYVAENIGRDPVLDCWCHFERTVWPRMAVVDMPMDVTKVCETVRAMADDGLSVMPIVDYVQLGASGEGGEYERVTDASHALQQLAKECHVPMLVLSSLRNVKRDERRELSLGMLRGSGHLGYDAGTVVMLQRDGERVGEEQPILASVVKNRVGPSGIQVPLMFNGGKNEFRGG